MSRDESIDWFHGRLSRAEAEEILRRAKSGDNTVFLVRESVHHINSYVLSVYSFDECYHYQILQHGDDAFFSIDCGSSIHHGLDELIEYYKNNDSNLCSRLGMFVKKGPPPTKFCRLGKANLLHRATKNNNLSVVREILSTSYNLDAKDESGMTAVHLAAINKVNPEIMKMLIEKGATVMSRDSVGNTALHYACLYQSKEKVEYLVNANKNLIHTRNNETGLVPLHEAARVGNMEIVKFLLANEAASMSRTKEGLFPSDFARDHGHREVAEYLDRFVPPLKTFSHKWHHGTLSREDARTLLLQKRNEHYEKYKADNPESENVYVNDSKEINEWISGMFLVRSSERNKGLDVITMLHDDDMKNIRNYVVQKSGKYVYIDDGPFLPSIEHLISYYMSFADGLPVKLTRIVEPIPKPPIPIPPPSKPIEQNIPKNSPTVINSPINSNTSKPKKRKFFNSERKLSLPQKESPIEPTALSEKFNKSISFSTDLLASNNNSFNDSTYDVPSSKAVPISTPEPIPYFTESDRSHPDMNDNCIEEIYFRDPPKTVELMEWNQLDPELYDTQKNLMQQANQATGTNYYVSKEELKMDKEIGSGEFGNVLRGILRLANGRKIWVAVKTLHNEHYEENYPEFLREASVMIKLDHPYIVKLIGITKGPPIGLVQELLLLGSLANYLQDHADEIDNRDIETWASQIALGMEYLESKRFVHRDLASRNILLASKDLCKISDFGLSRALGADKDFYQSSAGGRWPLKWYAPESFCGKFSHSSDVWSFGITLWELYSRGETPYGDKSGMEVNEFIEAGQRLSRPELCPVQIYKLMMDCWQYRDRLRPTFRYLARFFVNRLEAKGQDEENLEKDNDEHSNTVYV